MSNISIEEIQKFWDDRPCNIRHSNLPIGTAEYFNEVANKKFKVEPHIIDFTSFPDWKDKSVLEIGCGIGTVATEFARHGAIYTGVELSEKSLELTQQRFEVFGLSGNFHLGNAENLLDFLPNQQYDLVCSFGVIHHSPNAKKILSEVRKFMHKDSVIKIMVYAKNSYKNILIEAGLERPEAQKGCPMANTYSEAEIFDLFEGFEVTSLKQDHIFPYQIEPYYRGEYVKLPWFDSMPNEVFKALEQALGWRYLIEAKLK